MKKRFFSPKVYRLKRFTERNNIVRLDICNTFYKFYYVEGPDDS